jgi:membrane-associated protease RseP (regulator of RpoE activity)
MMTMFKVAACVVALCGAPAAAAVAPALDRPAPQTAAITRAQGPMAIFGGGVRLGVSIRDVEDADLKSAKLGAPAGAVVEEVSEDSAAEAAGIRKGDVIVEFDGERVRSARQLTRLVQETAEGRKVTAVVLRDGQRMNLTVEPRASSGGAFERLRDLEDLGREFRYPVPVKPSTPRPPSPAVPPVPPSAWNFDDLLWRGGGRLGLTVETLSPQLAEYFGTKEGVLVKSVQDNSPAAKIGIRAGDVITSVNGSAIDDAAELRRRIQSSKSGEEITLGIVREKKAMTLKGKLEGSARRRAYRTTI